MMRSLALLSSLLAALAATAACSVERTSSVLGPSSAAVTAAVAGKTSSPSLLGTWVLQSTVSTSTVSTKTITALPDFSSCTNFQWAVTTQTATEASGKFSADCAGGVSIVGTITGRLGGATIPIVLAGALTRGSDSCAFSLAGEGTPITEYEFRITYSGTTCVGPIQGANTLRLAQPSAEPTPDPTPAPAPPPAPAPAPVPSNGDQLDMHSVIVRGPAGDVANWPVTTTIRVLDFNFGGVFVDFSKKEGGDRWPDVMPPGWDGPIQYTIWMVVNHGGQWYTAGGVEFWHGLDRSGGPPSRYAQNWYYNAQVWGPLDQHQPRVGEQVGFFVTAGDQRAKDVRAVTERSNVVLVPFPSDGGAYYPF